MGRSIKIISICFAAGCIGGILNSISVWLSGKYGITTALGVKISPSLTAGWLYPRAVWGGLWGMLFLLPFSNNKWLKRGLIMSIGPSAAQLFFFFPRGGHDMMGLNIGTLTPLFVITFNAIWGITASLWIKYSGNN